jgi:hypothetical protein
MLSPLTTEELRKKYYFTKSANSEEKKDYLEQEFLKDRINHVNA